MSKWVLGPPKTKGKYHIAHIDPLEGLCVSEAYYDGKSSQVKGFDYDYEEVFADWVMDLRDIDAHKSYPTITKHWLDHLKETKRL